MTKPLKTLVYLAAFVLILQGCSKSNIGPEENNSDKLSTWVRDLAGDVDASVGHTAPGKDKRDFHSFLFRFSDQKQVWLKTKADSAKYLPQTDWDLVFSSLYNSSIYINNGEQQAVAWQGNGSKHKMLLIKENYDRVQTAPSDAEFDQSKLYQIGMITDQDSPGWYNYSTTSHLVQVPSNRTYVFRLSNGKYGKLQLINVYKGNPPAVTDLKWATPYFTFRYFIQADGSKNLKTY